MDVNGEAVSGKTFVWSSSDPAVATIESNGIATARGNGSTLIRAQTDGVTGTIELVVSQAPASVTVTPAIQHLSALGDTMRLSAVAWDRTGNAIAHASVTWTSTQSSVVAVSVDGLATAVANGSAAIVASVGPASAGAAADTAVIHVQQAVASVTVSPAADTLAALGDTVRLGAEALDANGHPLAGQSFVWNSLDPSIASTDGDGRVTAAAPGTAAITASTASASDTVTVSVIPAPASIVLSPVVDTLAALGDTVRVAATVRDANDYAIPGADVAWGSSAPGVATVDESGLVTAVSEGTATIAASSGAARATVDVHVEVASTIVFASDHEGNWEIYSILSNGTDLARLTRTAASEQWPVVSADGQRIAYTGGTEIYVMNIDGTDNQRVTWTGVSSVDPSWSPDGDALVISHRSCGGCIPRPHILTVSTGALVELPVGGNGPSWSHADSLIASWRSNSIEVNAVSSTTPSTIVVLQESAGRPRFSPGGDRVVFHGDDVGDGSNQPRIFAVDPDGGDLTPISMESYGSNPTWSPDGTRIAFSRGGNLWIMNADGTDLRQITFFPPGSGLMASWYN
ncbi:MAG TPA: Ig-like domain-containing protein [Longimicrobiales bacterium]|nr:Ig-like domain-containing protein [Longimicrobiales bacterium]